MMWSRLRALWPLVIGLAGCAVAAPSGYDPDWDATGPIADGKADGLLDTVPRIALGESVSGDVGGSRVEMYRIELRRTDRIEIEMRVTSGDLNPHLSLYFGTSTYVDSETWSSEGAVLRKVYAVEGAGEYILAARAYRGQGSGAYTLTVRCLGGPCNGELPQPETMDAGDVADCIAQGRTCAFGRLGVDAIDAPRAREILSVCLSGASLVDGGSCAAACDWQGEDARSPEDDAGSLCDDLAESLVFYSGRTAECRELVGSCMDQCGEAGEAGAEDAEELWATIESLCWRDGYNGSCNAFARSHEACGGTVKAGSAAECTELCECTTGAHIDDLDTLCSSDTDCADSCDVDLEQASEACGGLDRANEDCLVGWLDDNGSGICSDALEEALGNS